MRLVTVVIAAVLAAAPAAIAQSWSGIGGSASSWTGPGGISNTADFSLSACVAVGANGNPGVAWTYMDGNGNYTYFRMWDGQAWIDFDGSGSGTGLNKALGDLTSITSVPPSLKFGPNGAPIIAFVAGANSNVYVARWSLNSGQWAGYGPSLTTGISDVPVEDFMAGAERLSLAINAAGQPTVAWEDNHLDNVARIYVKQWAGQAQGWIELDSSATGTGISGAGSDDAKAPSLALDAAGHPVVAWQNGTWLQTPDILVRHWDGGAWVDYNGSGGPSGISATGMGFSPSLALDSEDHPHVAWQCGSSNGNQTVYYKYWDPLSSTWKQRGGSAPTPGLNVTGLGGKGASEPSLALTAQDNPVLAWTKITSGVLPECELKAWDGLAWGGVGGSDVPPGLSGNPATASAYPSLALDPDDNPVVAWAEDFGMNSQIFLATHGRRIPVPTNLLQCKADAITILPADEAVSTLVIRANIDSAGLDGTVTLEVKATSIEVPGHVFTALGPAVWPGGDTFLTMQPDLAGTWSWQARVKSSSGMSSDWVSFGANLETEPDFTSVMAPPLVDDGGHGGGGGGSKCGLMGIECVVLVLVLRLARRKASR